MTAITVHLPDDLAARLAALPDEEVNAYAVAALADLVNHGEEDAAELADTVAGIRRGLDDARAGHLLTLEEAQAHFDANFDAAFERFERKEAEARAAA